MDNNNIDIQKIFDKTDNGLDIILYYYPDAKPNKNFKIRDTERTASASLKQNKEDNRWLVTDFGGDSTPRNAIAICQKEEGLDFVEALILLCNRYNIPTDKKSNIKIGPEIRFQDKTDFEQTGKLFYFKDELSEFDLKTLGPYVTNETCRKYGLRAIDYYENYSSEKHPDKIIITKSTDAYPILCFTDSYIENTPEGPVNSTFYKIYQPLSPEKKFRFFYDGKKPKNHIYGLKNLTRLYDSANAHLKDEENPDNTEKKLEEVIICSGDRDAINVASLGYPVLWLNSETADLKSWEYNKLKKKVKTIYNLPDLDSTGIKQADVLANKYIDIKTIWLPSAIKDKKDNRGNACKDVTDYFKYFNKSANKTIFSFEFKKLVKVAMPLKFWDVTVNKNGLKYNFKTTYALNFLKQNGFFRFESLDTSEGYVYIEIKNNIVRKIPIKQVHKVKNYVINWLERNYIEIEVLDLIRNNGAKYSDLNLNSLPQIKINFTDSGIDHQYFSFLNETWKITKDSIKSFKSSEINHPIWEENIIKNKVKLEEDYFKISKLNDGDFDIEILNKNCDVLNYLINVSRMHWQKETVHSFTKDQQTQKEEYFKENLFNIAGPNLNADEQYEQKLHLINKIFSIGYLLHSYKNAAKPWAVFATDNRLSDENKSYGGSGKSLLYEKLIPYFIGKHGLPGRDKALFEDKFVFDGITEHNKYVIIDDASEYFKFTSLFSPITSDWSVNPKNNQRYSIKFKDSPKIAITSNFGLKNVDGSTERRILYTAFSDWYHDNTTEGLYENARTVVDDLNGKQFLNDWDEKDYNTFINFMMQCLKFYLGTTERINPPLNAVKKRNLLLEMGAPFKEWADVYFENRLNTEVDKEEMAKDALSKLSAKYNTVHTVTKKLKLWCSFYGYILDPKELCNSSGRIMKSAGRTSAYQVHYIASVNVQTSVQKEEQADDLPF